MFIKSLKKLISYIKGRQAVVKKSAHAAANLIYDDRLITLASGVVEDKYDQGEDAPLHFSFSCCGYAGQRVHVTKLE